MVTGKVGVCMATSGPGATNLVTPIADAHMDSVPMVAITGQVARCRRSAPTPSRRPTSAASPCRSPSTASWSPSPRTSPAAIASAFHIAGTGRPGPVLVDITKDALQARSPFAWPTQLDLPGYRPVTKPHGKQVAEAAQADPRSRSRPVLYVGGGVLKARRLAKELQELAELTGIPVVTTLMARGLFPDSHPQNMGMPGMHGDGGRGRRPAAQRPADRPRRPVRRPGDRAAVHLRAAGARSSTPTSTRPRSPRTGSRTCRSSATRKEVIAELIALLARRRPAAGRRRLGRATCRT